MKRHAFVALALTAGISVNVRAAASKAKNKPPPSIGGNEFNQRSRETKEDPPDTPEPKRPVIVSGTRGVRPESIADEFAHPTRSPKTRNSVNSKMNSKTEFSKSCYSIGHCYDYQHSERTV